MPGVLIHLSFISRCWGWADFYWMYVQALAECHKRGVVHGDVKPENVMSLKDKSGAVLVDFGSASIRDGAYIHIPSSAFNVDWLTLNGYRQSAISCQCRACFYSP